MSKKQIESLTPEQEAKIPEYLEKFRKIGLSTEPCNRPKAEAALIKSQEILGLPVPKIIWADSPEEGAAMAAMLKKGSYDITDVEFNEQISGASFGSFEAYWVSRYAFVANELPVEKDQDLLDCVQTIVEECGVYFTFEGMIVVSEKPVFIGMNEQKVLHCETGKALLYKDGTGISALDGLIMPDWLFDKPKSEISPSDILKLKDVDQRYKAMKWFGMENFLSQLESKILHKTNCIYQYELLSLTLVVDDRKLKGKFLKMKNPSEDKIHVEGVSDECKTVQDALQFRIPANLRSKYGYKEAVARA